MGTNEHLHGYLARIGLAGTLRTDLPTLAAIQQRHIATFPFENLNPLLGLPVQLDADWLYHKMVVGGRGGYCFEQNLLLRNMLAELGFRTRILLGRAGPGGGVVVGRTHLVLLVHLNGTDHLVDTGYGGLVPTGPLRLEPGLVQHTPNEDYRLLAAEDEYRLEVSLPGQWRRLYEFSLQKQEMEDLEVANWYTATSPASRFTRGLLAARAEGNRRFTLDRRSLSVYHPGQEPEKRELHSLDEMQEVLTETFRINLDGLQGLDKLMA
ncbi:MAG: arylamine N-acetyltransferase [Flavobacteriales bacterium]|nr:arylamine N-acetyltransferase [Flavobacteriales bacterium]MEB2342434.1 arylamine N-acetyltransferase [Flavobacteriia bacterium]